MGDYFIGTSGYNYKDWRELFYPKGVAQKKWLAYYSQHYNTVEINATFYRYFARTVFARWRDETPDDFRFTLKGPRDITHLKRLVAVDSELNRFLESIQDLKPKLAILLWQFPPSFKIDSGESMEHLTQFLACLPQDTQQVVEFRHKSWFTDEVYELLNKYKTGFVINDSSRFPAAEMVTGDVVYMRFHGPEQLYASSYSSEALKLWADKIRRWLKEYDVYGYFNNDFGGRAIRNSEEIKGLIQG